jgi:DNA polymerase III delta subunit
MPGKGETLTMKRTLSSAQEMTRHAFGLLLELREHHNALGLLSQAIAFLELLAREKEVDATPVLLSVRVAQLRKQ